MTERELRRTAVIIPPKGRAVLCVWAAVPGLLAAPFVFWQATRLSSSEPVTATKASQLATSAVRRVSVLMEFPQMTEMSSVSASIRH